MAKLFEEETNPLIFLENHVRKPLLTKFKNQYYQTKAEEAIASTLCAHLEDSIRDQIKKTIGATMVGKMKGSLKSHFSSKIALKRRILIDLFKEDNFEEYMLYIRNVKKCLHKWIKHYTICYCNEKESESSDTRLQVELNEEVSRLIAIVETAVTEVSTTAPTINDWLSLFSKRLESELGAINAETLLIGFGDSIDKISIENFQTQIWEELRKLQGKLRASYAQIKCEDSMTEWKDKPHELMEDLIGCTEQCPFCGEQCDCLDPNHYKDTKRKHMTAVHRPACLAKWRNKVTQVMALDFCPSLVASKGSFYYNDDEKMPYKKYTSIYPEWYIPPDFIAQTSLYWKWFVGMYSDKLAEVYNAKPAFIPRGWTRDEDTPLTSPEVARSLKVYHNDISLMIRKLLS